MSDERAPARPRATWSRRGWLTSAGASLAGSAVSREAGAVPVSQAAPQGTPDRSAPLPLAEFQPKSMLHVAETPVAARGSR